MAYNTVKSIPTLCTSSQLLFLIKHFEGRVTTHLFCALNGTVDIIKIIYHRYSNMHWVGGTGFCVGGGSLPGPLRWC